MTKYAICYSDETQEYEGENTPFWDLWIVDEDEGRDHWFNGVVGVTDLAEARRILGVPAEVILADEHACRPYTAAWTYEAAEW